MIKVEKCQWGSQWGSQWGRRFLATFIKIKKIYEFTLKSIILVKVAKNLRPL